MNSALDTLAYSNPALSALTIYSYVEGFLSRSKPRPHFALAFLAVPIALSREVAATFEGTTVGTGLRVWIDRNPSVRLDMASHIRDAASISRHGLVFGLQRQILTIAVSGGLATDASKLKRAPRDPAGAAIRDRPFTVAHRLGAWCGNLANSKAAFAMLGVSP